MTSFYCGNHHKIPVALVVNNYGQHSPFYSCPYYYAEGRPEDEKMCINRLNFIDAEAIMETFSNIIEEDQKKGLEKNYINMEFDYKKIHAKVIKYEESTIWIEIYNKKAFK